MSRDAVLALDLGAESGRAVLVGFDGAADPPLEAREVHRFANAPRATAAGLRWDLDALLAEVLEGIRRGVTEAAAAGWTLRSVGVDTWGVDFGLVDAADRLLAAPLCYRDPLAQEAFDEVVGAVGREELYRRTGTQFLPFNTLYQLAGMQRREPDLLRSADRLLFLPDLLHLRLTGRRSTEATVASTAQLADPATGDWARGLIDGLGLPSRLFGPVSAPGATLGELLPAVREATGAAPEVRVVLPPAHDTASAVLAVPAAGDRPWSYLSSGTWSLLGVERSSPVLSDAACAASFTNEWGVAGSFRFLKNITGLWLVQECRRSLAAAGEELDYAALTRLAMEAGPSPTRLDLVADPMLEAGDMPEKIRARARASGQPEPRTPGELVRCCLDGLAAAYGATLARLEELTGTRCARVHLVGGGARNRLLDQLTADAVGRPVLAGPTEATALGNALAQLIGLGLLGSVEEARAALRASVEVEEYTPAEEA